MSQLRLPNIVVAYKNNGDRRFGYVAGRSFLQLGGYRLIRMADARSHSSPSNPSSSCGMA
jgi:hypothetical protein